MIDATLTESIEEITEVTTEAAKELSIGEAGVTAVFGYAVVFFGLVILMCVLYCTGAYFKSKDAKAKAAAEKLAADKKAEEDKTKLLDAIAASGKSIDDIINMINQ